LTDLVKCEEPFKGGGVCGAYHHPREDGQKRCDLHRPPPEKRTIGVAKPTDAA